MGAERRGDDPMDLGTEQGTPLSGTQVHLVADGYEAWIASVGAALRVLRFRDRDLVRPTGADELHENFSGVLLAPWPNRVIDGRYSWQGQERELALSEPARGHALHGLLVWQDFVVAERSDRRALLTSTIEPRPGYPHRVRVDVEFLLDADGLTTHVRAELLAGAPAPFGCGTHPYLVAPGSGVDAWELTLPASHRQEVRGERLIPGELTDVRGTGLDFRAPRSLCGVRLDHAFTGLEVDAGGCTRVRVTDDHGVGVEFAWEASCVWAQVYTDDVDAQRPARSGLAVEPMSCPPGAFNSGTDLLRLEKGAEVSASWRLSALGA